MLDFGFCLTPFPYTNRKTRFVIEYTGYNFPVSTNSLSGYFKFIKNEEKRRVSFLLPEGATQRCNFSSKLITQHQTAINFLNDFLLENPNIQKGFFRYYVMDDNGTDVPFIPNKDDVLSNTAIEQAKEATNGILKILLVGGLGYLAYKHYRKGK